LFSEYHGMPAPEGEWRDEVYKDHFSPIIREGGGGRHSDVASFARLCMYVDFVRIHEYSD